MTIWYLKDTNSPELQIDCGPIEISKQGYKSKASALQALKQRVVDDQELGYYPRGVVGESAYMCYRGDENSELWYEIDICSMILDDNEPYEPPVRESEYLFGEKF